MADDHAHAGGLDVDDTDLDHRPSRWQSIRPWHPRLSLSVTEITSVSATFLISSLSSSNIIHDPDNDTPTRNTGTLSKGVSVKVNGTPWRKCLARLSDNADEALIIIYGLMPGRLYDIELGLIPGDEKLKHQIVTESASKDQAISDSEDSSGILPVGAFTSTTSNTPAVDPSPSPPSPSPPPTPSSGPLYSSQTFEDYLASLQLSLSHLRAEHETLSNTLKSARRDSQRAQAAQRAEISSLKRAAQKHSAGDTRMKQKVRALEEAVKQAIKCREDVETEYTVLEGARVEQEEELADASRRFEETRVRAEDWRARREKAEEEASSRLQGARAELAAVEARFEKLRAKRERLEGRPEAEEGGKEEEGGEEENGDDKDGSDALGGLVGELEAKLREILLERERIEADPYAQPVPSHTDETPIATAATDKPSVAPDTRAQGHATIHGRNASYSHARSKRPGPGQPTSHHHSYSHPHPPRATTTSSFPLPASSTAARTTAAAAAAVVSSTSPRNHPHSSRGTGTGKGSVPRRKSSPPPHTQAEKSALSLNARPFEPASIKGKNLSRV